MSLKYFFFLSLFTALLFSKNLMISTESTEAFFDNNFSKKACDLSREEVEKHPENFKINLHAGQCALNRGDIDTAMAAFDRADMLDEKSFLVHKCLGDMHAKVGNFELASSEYDKADLLCPTPVERILVENKNPHKFNFQLHLYRGFDDNIKLLGNISDINNQFGLSADSNEQLSDWFTKEYLSLEYLYKRDMSSTYYFKSKVEILNKNHDSSHEDDLLYNFIKVGPAWGNDKFDVWIPFEYTRASINYKPFSESFSLDPKLIKPLANSFSLMIELSYEYVKTLRPNLDDYSSRSGTLYLNKDFENYIIKAGYNYMLTRALNSENNQLFINHSYHEYNVAFTWNVSSDFGLNIDFTYRRSSYKDLISDTSMEQRSDDLLQYRSSLTHKIGEELFLITEYIRYNNVTNYTPLNYTQNIVSVGISSYF